MFNPSSYSNLKTNIIRRLKTFSQLKERYKFGDNIYRSAKEKYFSERIRRQ
jgi:hypothetical protein